MSKNFHNKYYHRIVCTELMLNEKRPVSWHKLADRRCSQTVLSIYFFCPPLRCTSAPSNNVLTRCQKQCMWALNRNMKPPTYRSRPQLSMNLGTSLLRWAQGHLARFISCLASRTWWGKPMDIRNIPGDPFLGRLWATRPLRVAA